MVILSRERDGRRGKRETSAPPPPPPPSLIPRFDSKVSQTGRAGGVLKVSRGSGPAQERRAGGRAHERSIMVLLLRWPNYIPARGRQCEESVSWLCESPRPAVNKVSGRQRPDVPSRPGCAGQLGGPSTVVDLNPIAAWVDLAAWASVAVEDRLWGIAGQLVSATGVLQCPKCLGCPVASSRYQVSVAAFSMVLGSTMRSICMRA